MYPAFYLYIPKIILPLYKKTMAFVYLGLGTNLGNKEQNLKNAVKSITMRIGDVLRLSSFIVTKPRGFESENDFLNAVVLVDTNYSPNQLLEKTEEIEKDMGRFEKSSSTYSDRLMDVDILFYDQLIINQPTLKIPHPLITERDFVLIPLSEIAPDFVHPILGKSISDLLKSL